MHRAQRTGRKGRKAMSRAREAVAALLAPALLVFGACGGSPDRHPGTEDEPAAEQTAGEVSDQGAGSRDAGSQTAGEAPAESGDHVHGPGTHTHAPTSADTLTAEAALQGVGDAGPLGSVTVLALGDSARIVVEIREVEAGSRYRAELAAGDCSESGESLTSLTPVMAGSSGSGSSQTTVAPGAVAGHSHGAIRLSGPSGSGASETAACAPVHLPASIDAASHDHQGG